jgi:membrane-associated phospholipid phosphatase
VKGSSLQLRSLTIVVLAFALCLAPAASRADTPPGADLDYKPALTLAATTLWLTTEFPLKRSLAPDSCRWCDRGEDGKDGLNGLDASMRGRFRWAEPRSAAKISDALLFVVVPAVSVASIGIAAGNDGRGSETAENALLMFEAVAVSAALNQAAKYTLARQRPYAHYAPEGTPPTSDDNLSFYSGHAAVTFTTSVAAGTIASMRGYSGANAVWIPGVILASAASYLRLGCDRHYFTDVLAGVAIGTGVGIAVPRLFHGGDDEGPAPGTASAIRAHPVISFRLAW